MKVERHVNEAGWELVLAADDEPMVLDVELGQRLGLARPRKLRELVSRLLRDGILNDTDVRPVVGRRQVGAVERTITEYLLTETAALIVIGRSDAPKALAITRTVIEVFLAVRRGLLVPRAAAPSEANAPIQARIGDDPRATDQLRGWFRTASKVTGRSIPSLQGELRKPWGAASVYRLPLVALAPTVSRLQELVVEASKRPRLPGDRRQQSMPWGAN